MSHRASAPLLRLICLLAAAAIFAGTGCARKPATTARSEPRFPSLPPKDVPDYLKGTVIERVDVANTGPKPVSGYGLVANLWGTGDSKASNATREYMVRVMEKRGFGSRNMGMEEITPERVLRDPRFAIVRVDGLIPP